MSRAEELQPLHLKYRPKNLDEIVGNKATVESIGKLLDRPSKPHSYLFTGPKGTGKTTLARIIASVLGCSARDFHEMNSASYRGIDGVRELITNSLLLPWSGGVAVYLLDECHQLTKDAQNAILKLLEEPPDHAYFVLATTDPEKLLDTIRSRCAHFAMRALPKDEVYDHLLYVVEAEECPDTHPTEKTLLEIARLCNGSMRQAMMMLDQVIDLKSEAQALKTIVESTGDDRQVIELCRALVKGMKWQYVQTILKNIDAEAESARHQVLGYFNTVILNDESGSVKSMEIARHFLPSMMYTGKAGLTIACFDALAEQHAKLRPANKV